MAHSKLSNVCRAPAAINSKLLSYSLPQTSQVAIETSPSLRAQGAFVAAECRLDVGWLSTVVYTAFQIPPTTSDTRGPTIPANNIAKRSSLDVSLLASFRRVRRLTVSCKHLTSPAKGVFMAKKFPDSPVETSTNSPQNHSDGNQMNTVTHELPENRNW